MTVIFFSLRLLRLRFTGSPNIRLMVDQLPNLAANSKFQLLGGAFGERKGDDVLRFGQTLSDENSDARGDELGLSRPRAGDDLEVAAG